MSSRARRLLVAGIVIVFGLAVIRTAWLSDDAFITLRSIDHWFRGYGLRWNIGERVQTYTHPLWMLLVAAGWGLWRDPYVMCALGLGASVGAALILLARARAPWQRLLWIGALLVVSKSFLSYSTSGLENPLTHLILAGFLTLLLGGSDIASKIGSNPPIASDTPIAPIAPVTMGTLLALAALAGLATLNRMDTLLLVGPPLGWAAWHAGLGAGPRVGSMRRRARILGLLALGFAPFIAWELFSLLYYGFLFPNTAYAKLSTGIPAGSLAIQGGRYFLNLLLWDPITLVTIALGLGLALLRGDGRRRAVAVGGILYLAYIVKIGGDFMAGRFFAAPFFVSLALLAHADLAPFAGADRSFMQSWRKWLPRLLLPLPLLGLVSAAGSPRAWLAGAGPDYHRDGVTDERIFYYHTTGWLARRPAPRDSYLPMFGIRLREQGHKVVVENCIGQVGWYAGPTVHILDNYALGDPLVARLPVINPRAWRIGHFERAVPDGYEATLATGRNRIADPSLRAFYDRLDRILRGELWSKERLGAILDMNLGRYDHLIAEYRARRK